MFFDYYFYYFIYFVNIFYLKKTCLKNFISKIETINYNYFCVNFWKEIQFFCFLYLCFLYLYFKQYKL